MSMNKDVFSIIASLFTKSRFNFSSLWNEKNLWDDILIFLVLSRLTNWSIPLNCSAQWRYLFLYYDYSRYSCLGEWRIPKLSTWIGQQRATCKFWRKGFCINPIQINQVTLSAGKTTCAGDYITKVEVFSYKRIRWRLTAKFRISLKLCVGFRLSSEID